MAVKDAIQVHFGWYMCMYYKQKNGPKPVLMWSERQYQLMVTLNRLVCALSRPLMSVVVRAK